MRRGIDQTVALLLLGLLGAACAPGPSRRSSASAPPDPGPAGAEGAGLEDRQEASLRGKTFQPAPELARVRFEYDRAALTGEAQRTLARNAAWLAAYPDIEVQIAGHCDERGTTEYNLALGQSRATAVRDYYKRLGVRMNRMSTISYGEEQPDCVEAGEDCWKRNRRATTLARKR